MTHLAVPRILIGPNPPWTEPEHIGTGDGTVWLDTATFTLRIRTAAQPDTGQEIGASSAVVAAILAPLLARLDAAEARLAKLEAAPVVSAVIATVPAPPTKPGVSKK